MTALKYNIENLDYSTEKALYVFKLSEHVLKLMVNNEGYYLKVYRNEVEIRKGCLYHHSDDLAQSKAIHETERAVKLLMELDYLCWKS